MITAPCTQHSCYASITHLALPCPALAAAAAATPAVPYTGPSTFQRCLAARQLAWLAQQLHGPALTEPQTLGLLLPLVLAVADDPSPCMRQYGHSTLGWVGLKAAAGGLQWQAALLREEARRLVVGCEESCWGTALPAATSLIMVSLYYCTATSVCGKDCVYV